MNGNRRRICFTWELGGGFGHIGPFEPVARELARRGYHLTAIVKDLSRVQQTFRNLDIQVFQAPIKTSRSVSRISSPCTYVELLLNMGYGNREELASMVAAWRNLFAIVRPDFLLFDHSPTAMVAARGLGIPSATFGTGFCCPIDHFPMLPMASWRDKSEEERRMTENAVVARLNTVLKGNRQPQVDRIGQLFGDIDRHFLCTFRELDHFPQRKPAEYFGSWSASDEALPRSRFPGWPRGDGPRLFGYLKPMKAIRELVAWISRQGFPTVLVGDGLDFAELAKHAGRNILFSERPINLAPAKAEADLALLNANHGSTCEFLLAGKPILQMPITLEQTIQAHRNVELGVSLRASPIDGQQAISQLETMSECNSFCQAAEMFSRKYSTFRGRKSAQDLVGTIEAMV